MTDESLVLSLGGDSAHGLEQSLPDVAQRGRRLVLLLGRRGVQRPRPVWKRFVNTVGGRLIVSVSGTLLV